MRPRVGTFRTAVLTIGTLVGVPFSTMFLGFNAFMAPQLEQMDSPMGRQFRKMKCVCCGRGCFHLALSMVVRVCDICVANFAV